MTAVMCKKDKEMKYVCSIMNGVIMGYQSFINIPNSMLSYFYKLKTFTQ